MLSTILLQNIGIDTGSTGFMLLATSLVMLMTPGLAFFYGGLATKRNILGIMIQSFVSLGWTTVLWIIFGYSLCFSGGEGGIIGNFDKAFLNGISFDAIWSGNGKIPELVFVAYQMMFAIITPALITGAFVNRVTFKAYMIFLTFWQILVYYPFVHMIWGGGLLADWGVLDFAGGIVVHATAGFAALASVFYVGARTDKNSTPNSIPLVAIGSGLLWFGWYGFNAGSEVQVDFITSLAFINTDIAASFAKTKIRGIAHRFHCRSGDHNTLCGFCARLGCSHHWHRSRTCLLPGCTVQEQDELGRCAGRLGSTWCRRVVRDHYAGYICFCRSE